MAVLDDLGRQLWPRDGNGYITLQDLVDTLGASTDGTAATLTLAGYTIAGTAVAVAASDTISAAIGKLEKRVKDLEDA
jgi:hypothetical protein